MKLGLCQWEIRRTDGPAAWAARLDAEVTFAASQGAELLVLPEYAPLECAAGTSPDPARELQTAIAQSEALLDAARSIAQRHRVWLIPGSLPRLRDGLIRNQSPLIAPDGRFAVQEKHAMTRFEAEDWHIAPGRPPTVFDTPFGRLGIAICFDVEFPQLVRAQVEAGAWLILVPTCTDTPHGFNRVRIAAAARAMENQCFVAITPTVGTAPWSGTLDANTGHAAVFGPVDRGFPADGVIATGTPDRHEWLFADLDPQRLAPVRRDGQVRNHWSWPPTPAPCPVVPLA